MWVSLLVPLLIVVLPDFSPDFGLNGTRAIGLPQGGSIFFNDLQLLRGSTIAPIACYLTRAVPAE
jgi:hypothetical protein